MMGGWEEDDDGDFVVVVVVAGADVAVLEDVEEGGGVAALDAGGAKAPSGSSSWASASLLSLDSPPDILSSYTGPSEKFKGCSRPQSASKSNYWPENWSRPQNKYGWPENPPQNPDLEPNIRPDVEIAPEERFYRVNFFVEVRCKCRNRRF
ncbi:hypothetical protein TcasGA2_TC004471 [Tribolium castaneum]|uniref:Uncharacterized protein n=1 Tax=Tribolium castaneum TaxID=7070 RepID=D6WCK3_TRICA|nr:hypothetical protein TcasGA2_TC004471 [Tribolium castaneum]